MNRAEIERELLAWMRDAPAERDDERFGRLALALFAWQVRHNPAYGRFAAARGSTPESVTRWEEIPAVPTGAFKEVDLRAFPAADTVHTFRTSGTSSGRPGLLHLDTLALYEASLVPTFVAGVLPDLAPEAEATLLVLAPSTGEAPESSLSWMFEVVIRERGAPGSGFFVRDGQLDVAGLHAAIAAAKAPLALCGTAFAFVHWLEAIVAGTAPPPLPADTRLMETGGFKGRARERSQAELYAELGAALGLAPERIVNQYGMTELGSQFYDTVLAEPEAPRRKRVPPWVRVRVVDPASGEAVATGEPGMLQILDLANTGSVATVLTADLGRTLGDGFVVLGRDADAEARGCSIAADEMLGGGG